MKKVFIAVVVFIFLAMFSAAPVFAVGSWDDLVAGLEKSEAVREKGAGFLAELRSEAPRGSELDLWRLLWVGEARSRAAAGVALMDSIFPGGDPGRWESASGFLGGVSYRPRQLAGLDAFFVTVAALDAVPGGEWTAALLMNSFASSARGMMYFIEQMPHGLQEPIASIAAKTGVRGDWSARVTRRPLPLLPTFGGRVSRDTVESRRWQYLNGFGSIADNGYYAWDRDRGYLYKVAEDSESFWRYRR